MSTRGAHNVAVLREIASVASSHVTAKRDAWVHGFSVGIALTLQAPDTAREVRAEIERIVSKDSDTTPEEVEVYLRSIADLFDRSLDK